MVCMGDAFSVPFILSWPNRMTSTWKKDFFPFCVLFVGFFLFSYLHFLVLFLLFWFIRIFSIHLLLSAFFHPHPPSAGIRSAFYRHPKPFGVTLCEPCYSSFSSSRSSKRAITDQIFPGIAFFLVFRKHVRYVACLRAWTVDKEGQPRQWVLKLK